MLNYNKYYKNDAEKNERALIWKQNKTFVDDLNKEYGSNKFKVNWFADIKEDEKVNFLGRVPSEQATWELYDFPIGRSL